MLPRIYIYIQYDSLERIERGVMWWWKIKCVTVQEKSKKCVAVPIKYPIYI